MKTKRNIFQLVFIILILSSCQNPNESTIATPSSDYSEPHRNQFHFSPPANWMNDPNGMFYLDGEYHLFYQYYPDSTVWGPMHWGHAISRDLVKWEHQPIALYPDDLGYIFSGSAVVDINNTSGLGDGSTPPVIAMFTHHNIEGERSGQIDFQYQSIAYSLDKGRSWNKYDANPVIHNPGIKDFRDPKVIWHSESNQWIMVLAAYDKVMIYNSPNLLDWTYASEFGINGDTRLWECPDLFPMKVEGTDIFKWILISSIQKEAPNDGTATSYFVGDFDGKNFIADPEDQKWLDYGKDNYAFVTWSNILKNESHPVGIGWMSNWQYAQQVPTEIWRSAMTLPRTLSLHQTEESYEIRSSVIDEIESLVRQKIRLRPQTLSESTTIARDGRSLYKLELNFKTPETPVVIRFSNNLDEFLNIGLNPELKKYFIDRSRSGTVDFGQDFANSLHWGDADYLGDEFKMEIYLDHASVELFADGGRCVMTDIFFANEPFSKIEIFIEDGTIDLLDGIITELNGIW